MASPPSSSEREEERRHNVQTLVIASIASASAALIVSQLWIAGTWIAAALTPVLVTLISELLHRPTERLARGVTGDRPALRQPTTGEPPVRIYRAGSDAPTRTPTRTRRRKIAYGAVLGTAALAFAIAVVALTVPELVAGQSVGRNDGRTTFFGGGGKKKSNRAESPTETRTSTTPSETTETKTTETTPTQPTETTPSETTPPQQTAPTQTTPPG